MVDISSSKIRLLRSKNGIFFLLRELQSKISFYFIDSILFPSVVVRDSQILFLCSQQKKRGRGSVRQAVAEKKNPRARIQWGGRND